MKGREPMDDRKSIRELFKDIEESFNFDLVEKANYKEAFARKKEKTKLLENCLSKENFDLFQEYIDKDNQLSSIEIEEAFVKGFSMAYKFLMDSLQ